MSVILMNLGPSGSKNTGICRDSLFPTWDRVNTRAAAIRFVGEADTDRRHIKTPSELREMNSERTDRWAVVLLNDDHHSMEYVIWALLKTVPELTQADATFIMLETHNTGKGVVAVCSRQVAEQYRESLRVLQLSCEIAPGW